MIPILLSLGFMPCVSETAPKNFRDFFSLCKKISARNTRSRVAQHACLRHTYELLEICTFENQRPHSRTEPSKRAWTMDAALASKPAKKSSWKSARDSACNFRAKQLNFASIRCPAHFRTRRYTASAAPCSDGNKENFDGSRILPAPGL